MIKELKSLVNIKSYSRRSNVQIIFKEGVKTRNVVVERQNNMVSVPRELMQYCLVSRDGAVVKTLVSHQCTQCGPGSIPGLDVIGGFSLLLVLYSALRGFSPGTPVFSSPQKPTFPNSNSIRMQDLPENHFAVSGASWVNIMIYLVVFNEIDPFTLQSIK